MVYSPLLKYLEYLAFGINKVSRKCKCRSVADNRELIKLIEKEMEWKVQIDISELKGYMWGSEWVVTQ